MQRIVYFNGSMIPESEAKVSIYDSAMMFGDVVFEMTRSFNKVQFKLRQHLERLFMSLKYVHLDCHMSIDQMEEACYNVIKINDNMFNSNDEHRLLINVTRGALSIYKEVKGLHMDPNIIIADFPLRWTVQGMGNLYDIGVNAVISHQHVVPSYLIDPKVKNRNRLHYLMANIEVSNYKGSNNWALLLDTNHFVAEGSGANFFIVSQGKVITPKGHHVLRGISRSYVFELCKQLDLEHQEKDIDLYDVHNAEEAFMTATPFCIMPVTSINGSVIGTGLPGYITKQLLLTWSTNVGVDIVSQIKEWNKKDSEEVGISPYNFK